MGSGEDISAFCLIGFRNPTSVLARRETLKRSTSGRPRWCPCGTSTGSPFVRYLRNPMRAFGTVPNLSEGVYRKFGGPSFELPNEVCWLFQCRRAQTYVPGFLPPPPPFPGCKRVSRHKGALQALKGGGGGFSVAASPALLACRLWRSTHIYGRLPHPHTQQHECRHALVEKVAPQKSAVQVPQDLFG